jgi:hypothetical protein
LPDTALKNLLRESSIIHIGGAGGSGKTLLAAELAAWKSRTNSVDWLCADGKRAFIGYLKRAVKSSGGVQSNLILTIADNHQGVLQSILSAHDRLRSDTALIIVDPITRVLDMSRKDEIMWGRALFEEALPTLAGLSIQREISLLITSEVRFRGDKTTPVFWENLRTWLDADLLIKKQPDSNISEIYDVTDQEAENLLASFTVNEAGLSFVEDESKRRIEENCSEGQYIA